MIPKSIRWRLPLSYAAIALLAVLSLGLVLLTILQNFYRQQELDYLNNNAQTISATLAPLVESGLSPEALQSQLSSYAFLSQTQVRLLDATGQVLADSGNPQNQQQEVLAFSIELDVEADASSQTLTQTVTMSDQARNYSPFIAMRNIELEAPPAKAGVLVNLVHYADGSEAEEKVFLKEKFAITASELPDLDEFIRQETGLLNDPYLISGIPVAGTPYGFGLGSNQASDGPRSEAVVSQPIYDEEGDLLGYVELSEGPAYGQQVLGSVAQGWAIAGSVAVLLAAVVGWGISRRLSVPLLDLTSVTTRMAAGDLSVRADVTQRTSYEIDTLAHTFNHMARRVEEIVVTLRRFVADASHELHTPLTALRTNLELAMAGDESTNQYTLIGQAQAQVVRLETLTGDLLDLSRLETETMAVSHTSLDLVALLQDVCEPYASQAEQAGQSFLLHLPEDSAFSRGNEVQLRRAIGNLLDNALKFTLGGGQIRVGLRPTPDKGWFEIWVEDTGIGIPREELPQLFSRFHRGRNAAAYPGSGLGLAIVKVIVEGHGGQVTAENTDDGACFIMRLPTGIRIGTRTV